MWQNPQETGDLVTFTEEILNGKLYYLSSVIQFISVVKFAITYSQPLSYRNQSIDWFLYDKGLRHERVKHFFTDKSHLLYSTCNENYFWVSNTYILKSCVFQNSDRKNLRQSKWLMTKGISKMKTIFWLPLSLNCFYKNPVF